MGAETFGLPGIDREGQLQQKGRRLALLHAIAPLIDARRRLSQSRCASIIPVALGGASPVRCMRKNALAASVLTPASLRRRALLTGSPCATKRLDASLSRSCGDAFAGRASLPVLAGRGFGLATG